MSLWDVDLNCSLQDIGTLATFNKELGELQDAAVYVSGNVIQWVGATKDIPKKYQKADTVISLPDGVMIPGLVNSHHHMWQCLTRCVAQVKKLHLPSYGVCCIHRALMA